MKRLWTILFFALLCLSLFTACNEIDHEHTYEYISHEAGHFKQYTCGCPSPDILEEHYDRDGDLLCDACKLQISVASNGIPWQYSETHHWWTPDATDSPTTGVVYAYGEHQNHDADLFCDICGYDMSPAPTNHFLRNLAGCEWLSDIKAEDIAKIKIASHASGVAPGAFKTIVSSVDEATIQSLFEQYYWLDTTPISAEHAQVPGGGNVTVTFIRKDGTEKSLSLFDGNYCDTNGTWFKLHSVPTFSEGDNYVTSYGFVTYNGTSSVWACDPIGMEGMFICDIATDELEFMLLTDDIYLGGTPIRYRVDTEFGTLYFLSEDYFYIAGHMTGDTAESLHPIYYQLTCKNLEELISDALTPKYALTINRENWLYEDLPAEAKAGDRISVKLRIIYDVALMLFVNGEAITPEIGDTPYLEYLFTMPEGDANIHIATYNGFVPNVNYFILCEAYLRINPSADFVSVRHYYGEFDSGAIVAIIDAGISTESLTTPWEETVGGETFYYTDSNRIVVLYEGVFYTLSDAYQNGYLTLDELKDIAEKHLDFSIILF